MGSQIGIWTSTFNELFYTSATVVATGDSGIVATPLVVSGGPAIFPIFFLAIGFSMATDEENTLTIDWYTDAAGSGGIIGTTTFANMTAGAPIPPIEVWPGDVTGFGASRDLVPLFPFMKVTHTLAGTTKSMSYRLYISFLRVQSG